MRPRGGGQVAELVEKYPWIPSERHLFGQAGGAYDWEATDPEGAFKQVRPAPPSGQPSAPSGPKRPRRRPPHPAEPSTRRRRRHRYGRKFPARTQVRVSV